MARIHVFAVDWVPEQADVSGGGGMRSLQIIEALRGGGHDVTYSVPRQTRATRALRLHAPGRVRQTMVHDMDNQAEILRETRPDVVFWLWPAARNLPFTPSGNVVNVCDLNGLQDREMAKGAVSLLESSRARVVQSCAWADLLLTGSAAQHGYWMAELGRYGTPPPAVTVPYALVPGLLAQGAGTEAGAAVPLRTLHITGNLFRWSSSAALLAEAAAWVARHPNVTLEVISGSDAGQATDLEILRRLRLVQDDAGLHVRGEVPVGEAMASYGDGSVLLDLSEPSVERDLAVPIRAVNALAHGVPLLMTVASVFARDLIREGAAIGIGEGGLAAALDRFAAMPAQTLLGMSTAARAIADRDFNPVRCAGALLDGLHEAIDRRTRRLGLWHTSAPPAPPLSHVLVISAETSNLLELRVSLPMGSLLRRRLIGGYSIFTEGRIGFSSSTRADHDFDAIWVQRSVSPEIALLLYILRRPFVYDLDDNLLVSPSYRAPFSPENMQAVRGFLRSCGVFSASTARLAATVQRRVGIRLVEKSVVTPNLTGTAPPAIVPGPPRCVVWSSSDTPALTSTRLEVVRAVRDFCLTHELRLVCLGAAPIPMFAEGGVTVEHIGMLGYAAYMDTLRSLAPAIMVCPLETDADPETRDFIESKSDIKILEALATGLVGVFSSAPAYLDSTLPTPILCDNLYTAWFDGLERARRACLNGARPVIPEDRHAAALGPLPYFEALDRVRLRRPITLADFSDAQALIRGRFGRRRLSHEDFDCAFYLAKYPDVRLAVERGIIGDAYEHYATTGFDEQRHGREGDATHRGTEQWWANLFHTIGDLRSVIESRHVQIEDFKLMRAMRQRMAQRSVPR